MFGIGSTELLVIFVVALIVLGPKSIPQLAKTLGKAMGEFKRVSTEFQRTMNAEVENEEHEKRKKEAEQELFGKDRADATASPAAAPTPAPANSEKTQAGQPHASAPHDLAQENAHQVVEIEPDAVHASTPPDTNAFAPDSPLAKAVAKAEAEAAQRDAGAPATQAATSPAQTTDSTKGNA